MADKKRGLGRGLSALLPGGPPPVAGGGATVSPIASAVGMNSGPNSMNSSAAAPRSRTYFAAGIEDLYPSPEQPRRKFDETKLGELADSIKAHGIIVPLVVR